MATELPQPPGMEDIRAKPEMTMAEFIGKHFFTVKLPHATDTNITEVPACLVCGSLVMPGNERRHYQSLHGFKGF